MTNNFYLKNQEINGHILLKEWYIKTKEKVNFKCWICWKIWNIEFWKIKYNETKSCWCLKNNINKTHWFSKTRFYNIFIWILKRCNNIKSINYKNYGWRWIKCEWNSFEEFHKDMFESYEKHCKDFSIKDTSIDRMDVNWNYSKDNCNWATSKIQNNNQRRKLYWYKWEYHTKTQWLKILWIKK